MSWTEAVSSREWVRSLWMYSWGMEARIRWRFWAARSCQELSVVTCEVVAEAVWEEGRTGIGVAILLRF